MMVRFRFSPSYYYRQSISHNPFYDMLAARKKKAQKNATRA